MENIQARRKPVNSHLTSQRKINFNHLHRKIILVHKLKAPSILPRMKEAQARFLALRKIDKPIMLNLSKMMVIPHC
jgi:hypothetical protein